jgi:cytoskeletal protein RodZ
MRNMLALFAALILTVVGLGWYLNWYKVRSQPASVPGQHSVGIDINTNKISTDVQNAEQKFQKMLENKAKEETDKAASDAKKTGDLMLPSPPSAPELKIDTGKGSALEVNTSDKGPLFQFNTKKGSSIQFGNQGTTIQFGGEKKP